MKQLKIREVLNLLMQLEAQGLTLEEIAEIPVFIGDDDELNGIHTAWFCQGLAAGNSDDRVFIEMIGERSGNVGFSGRAILIS